MVHRVVKTSQWLVHFTVYSNKCAGLSEHAQLNNFTSIRKTKIRKFLPFTFLIIPATLRLFDNPGCNLQQWLESCMKHCSVFTLSVPLNIQTISAKFLVAQLRHPSELIPIIGKIGERKKSNYLTFSFALIRQLCKICQILRAKQSCQLPLNVMFIVSSNVCFASWQLSN